jgi:RNA polymerase sigma-70 factor (ECF subfamily)
MNVPITLRREAPMNGADLLRLYPAHRSQLVARLARLVGAADAEDMAQETLLRAMAAVDGFRGEASLGTWLHRIGVNLAYDLLRQRARQRVLALEQAGDVPEAVAEDDGDHLEQQQMTQCVRDLLATLPPRQRDPLLQADMLERTAPEIARDAGITVGNAKIRLHRARQAMKAVLEAYCDFERTEVGVLCCTPKAERSPCPVSFAAPDSSKAGTDPVPDKEPHHA